MNKKTLVLGASLKPNRYSNYAIQRLVANKNEVVAFGLEKGNVSGIEIDTSLLPYRDIHTVTLYLNAKRQKDYYDYILSLKPERVIFNPGTENEVLETILRDAGIVVETACTLVLLATNQYQS